MTSLLDNLNEEQKKAVSDTRGPLLIVAGAGTGKTMVITKKIAWLIKQKLSWQNSCPHTIAIRRNNY